MSTITNAMDRAQKQLEILQLHAAYKDVFESRNGQKVLRHLMRKFYEVDTFVQGAPDLTNHKEGRRYVIKSILDYMKKEPMEIIKQTEQGS